MARKYLAFDLETAKDVPGTDFDWRAHRPLGIACAAALPHDAPEPTIWYGRGADGTPAARLSAEEARGVVDQLVDWTSDGYTLVTWNGLGFDLDVLSEESGAAEDCKKLALDHVDMMFHVFCDRGFPVSLEKAAEAMRIPGKLAGMSGILAPRLWAEGRHQEVIDYVAQDVRITLQIAQVCDNDRSFRWMTRKGSPRSINLPRGWLTVKDAMKLPTPDTSWMDSPVPRRRFTQWLGKH